MTATSPLQKSPKRIVIACVAIFLIAFGVRTLSWHDTQVEVGRVQIVVAEDYQRASSLLRQGGVRGFFSSSGPLADPNLLGHPPGYPIARSLVWYCFGDSNTAIQLVQIICDSLAAVLIFLITVELLPFGAGVIAGLLVALSPQFAWNSVLLLPDTLAVFPLLLAAYCLVKAFKKPSFGKMLAAGALIGLSCWLRANALLMSPFLAVLVLILFEGKRRSRFAGALLAGTLIVVAPLTIRNWIVFKTFIPVSLGAGQTMLEGIADYDPSRRFGIPDTDMEIMRMEAEQYNRPDYYSTLFAPDGIQRERMRLARGFKVIRENPFWFAGVMTKRAGSMLRLERVRLISNLPVVTRHGVVTPEQRIWSAQSPQSVANAFQTAPGAEIAISVDGNSLRIKSDNSKYGTQLVTEPIAVKQNYEYLLRVPVIVDEGRMTINVVSTDTQRQYGSAIIEKVEVKSPQPPPLKQVEVPFVTESDGSVRLAFKNNVARSGYSVVKIGAAELFELGPARFLWTRVPRIVVKFLQRAFITAVMLPLAIIGGLIFGRRLGWRSLLLLLGIPAYYLLFQSMLHTEYRYVLAIHYFLFTLVALALYTSAAAIIRLAQGKFKPAQKTSF